MKLSLLRWKKIIFCRKYYVKMMYINDYGVEYEYFVYNFFLNCKKE